MPARGVCKICTHPDRHKFEVALVMNDASFLNLQEKYGVSRITLKRHWDRHVPADKRKRIYAEEKKARMVRADAEADMIVRQDRIDIVSTIKNLEKEIKEIYADVRSEKDHALALRALGEVRHLTELALKVQENLDDGNTQTISMNHPGLLRVRDLILSVLERHPAAKKDFLETLGTLSGTDRVLT